MIETRFMLNHALAYEEELGYIDGGIVYLL